MKKRALILWASALSFWLFMGLAVFSACGKQGPVEELELGLTKTGSVSAVEYEVFVLEEADNPDSGYSYRVVLDFEEATGFVAGDGTDRAYFIEGYLGGDDSRTQKMPWEKVVQDWKTGTGFPQTDAEVTEGDLGGWGIGMGGFLASALSGKEARAEKSAGDQDQSKFLVTADVSVICELMRKALPRASVTEGSIFDFFFGMEISEYSLAVTVDDKTGCFVRMDLNAQYEYRGSSDSVQVIMNILAMDEEVEPIVVPQEDRESIYEYIDKQYDGPRSYEYRTPSVSLTPELPQLTETWPEDDETGKYSIFKSSTVQFDIVSERYVASSDAGWDSGNIYIYSKNMTELTAVDKRGNWTTSDGFLYVLSLDADYERYSLYRYDLKTLMLVETIKLGVFNTDRIYVADDRMVVCSDGEIRFFDLETGECLNISEGYNRSELFDSHARQLYVTQSEGYGNYTLTIYDLNGNLRKTMQFQCENMDVLTVYEDGRYFHVNGACYDKQTLEKVYDGDLYGDFGKMRNFIAVQVVYDDDRYALILGYYNNHYVSAVYDKTLQGYVFRGNFFSTSAYREEEILYVHTRQRLSVLDLSGCDKLLAENIGSEVFALDGQSTARFLDNVYLDAVSDGKYIYTIDLTKALFVYDVSAFSLVKKVDLPFTPQCMDSDGNKIAVGFGDASQFTLIDTDTWAMQTVTTDCQIEEICVYGNRIVYASDEHRTDIYIYDCDKKITKRILGSYSEATIAVNKADGILYIGERGISSSDLVYYDLQKEEIVYQSPFGIFSYNYARIHFDGENVHYCGLMLDKLTGKRYYGEQYIQMFPEEVASDVRIEGCVYFDGVYSVMVVTRNKEKFTWVYNKETGSVREIPYETSNVIRTDEVLVLVRRGTDTLVITAL